MHPRPHLPARRLAFADAEPVVRQPDGRRAIVFPESDFPGPAHGFPGVLRAGVGTALRRRRPVSVGEREPESLRHRH